MTAEELLNSLDENDPILYTAEPEVEGHIIIGKDRKIIVPEALKRIAVQYDQNIETVTFDCIRYWDNNDLSTFRIYIDYTRADGKDGIHPVSNIIVDEADDTIMHFDWQIDAAVAEVPGNLEFGVCATLLGEDGVSVKDWNSELNNEMYISKGKHSDSQIVVDQYPDLITQLINRMDATEKIRYKAAIELDGTAGHIVWNYSKSDTAIVTLTADKALSIENAYDGARASLDVYGGKLILDDSLYLKSVTYAYLEAVEGQHYHYEFQLIGTKWQVCVTVMEGAEP